MLCQSLSFCFPYLFPFLFKLCNLKPDKKGIINLREKDILKYNILQHNTNARYLFGSENMLMCHKETIKLLNMVNVMRKGGC